MSDYQLIIHTDSVNFGHFSVELRGPNGQRAVYGYYPKDEKKWLAASTLPVPGNVQSSHEAERLTNNAATTLASDPIPLTPPPNSMKPDA